MDINADILYLANGKGYFMRRFYRMQTQYYQTSILSIRVRRGG